MGVVPARAGAGPPLPPPLAADHPRSHKPPPCSHLLADPHAAPEDAPGIPLAAAAVLKESFVRRTTTLVAARASPGGGATKLLLRLQDGLEVESVIMEYDTTADGGARGGLRRTLCVSSQAGCAMGCTFCATGTMGELGSLYAAEILEQADWAAAAVADAEAAAAAPPAPRPPATPGRRPARPSTFAIRNVVFMGMGEPLNNYEAVVAAVAGLTDSRRFGLRRSAVTVSTVGVVPRLRTMAADMPGVSLALSLHAPDQATRARIVPSARAYPLPRLMDAVARYQAASGRRVFVEYVLLAGVNDAVAQAEALGELLKGRDVVVNLIPWNPVPPPPVAAAGSERDAPPSVEPPELFAAPGAAAVDAFAAAVRAAGLPATVRKELGQDVAAACGQLALTATRGVGKGGRAAEARDIEDAAPAPAGFFRSLLPASLFGGGRPVI